MQIYKDSSHTDYLDSPFVACALQLFFFYFGKKVFSISPHNGISKLAYKKSPGEKKEPNLVY